MSKDPARLTGKGGILLKEEKLRKRINRDKPKVKSFHLRPWMVAEEAFFAQLETELRPTILAWEQENGTQFIINGVRFLDTMSAPKSEPESKPVSTML
jgi:protein regulator of cytokinesis 1